MGEGVKGEARRVMAERRRGVVFDARFLEEEGRVEGDCWGGRDGAVRS